MEITSDESFVVHTLITHVIQQANVAYTNELSDQFAATTFYNKWKIDEKKSKKN